MRGWPLFLSFIHVTVVMVSLSQQVINIKQNNERDEEMKTTRTKAKTARRPATSTATQSAEGRVSSRVSRLVPLRPVCVNTLCGTLSISTITQHLLRQLHPWAQIRDGRHPVILNSVVQRAVANIGYREIEKKARYLSLRHLSVHSPEGGFG